MADSGPGSVDNWTVLKRRGCEAGLRSWTARPERPDSLCYAFIGVGFSRKRERMAVMKWFMGVALYRETHGRSMAMAEKMAQGRQFDFKSCPSACTGQ